MPNPWPWGLGRMVSVYVYAQRECFTHSWPQPYAGSLGKFTSRPPYHQERTCAHWIRSCGLQSHSERSAETDYLLLLPEFEPPILQPVTLLTYRLLIFVSSLSVFDCVYRKWRAMLYERNNFYWIWDDTMAKLGAPSSKLAPWGRVFLDKGNQVISVIAWDPKVHYLVYNSIPLFPVLPSTARSSKTFLAFKFSSPTPTPQKSTESLS